MLGNRGLANLLVYVVPGVALELGMLVFPNYVSTIFSAFIAGMLANATGAAIVSLVFMRVPLIPFLISLAVSAVTGGLGGVVGFKLYEVLNRLKAVPAGKGYSGRA